MTATRILVATDFSVDSDAALAYALALARTIPASVHVVHVVDNPMAAGIWSSEVYTSEIEALHINLVRDAARQLRRGLRAIDHHGVKLTSEVRTGRPGPAIVVCACDGRYELVIVGSHGRTGLSHLLMGSVAEHVVRHAPCPVLVVRPLAHAQENAAAS